MALDPDQYQRGAILNDTDSGDRYDVRGSIGAEGGGRFLVLGKLGEPHASVVAEDAIRENDGDRYEPLDEDDAIQARQEAYDQYSSRNDPDDTPDDDTPAPGDTSSVQTPPAEPTPDTPATGGTEGTSEEGTPQTPPADTTPGTTPEPGGTADSTAPATPEGGNQPANA